MINAESTIKIHDGIIGCTSTVDCRESVKFYLASPFFSEEELHHVSIMESVLDSLGHTVFSPRKNQMPEFEFGGFEWRTNVFRNDINHIKWADAVIAIIDNNYDDTGTAFEVGYAYAMGKPIYVYNPTGDTLNLMVTDSLHGYFESLTEIIDYDFKNAPAKPYMKEVV